jgi:two-component SAPR family response regulator
MKRVGVVLSWMFFSIGVPTALIFGGFTPHASLITASSNLFDGNLEIFLLQLASVSLWLVWSYGLIAFVRDLWHWKFHNASPKASFGFRHWITICAAAVASLVLTNHATGSTNTSNSVDVSLVGSQQAASINEADLVDPSSPTPLALSASAVLVAGILQCVQQHRQKVLRNSVPHSQIQSLSRRCQSTLTELQLVATATSCDGIRKAMNALMESEFAPILSSWRPNSASRIVLQRTEHTLSGPPLCCVPLGLAQGEIVLLTLSCGGTISVTADDGGRARRVLTHLAHSIILETIGTTTNVMACGFTDAELINVGHFSTVDSVENLVEHVLRLESSGPTIVCSADPLSMDVLNQLRELGCCIVTASIDLATDVALVHTEHGWTVHPTEQLISLYGISLDESIAVSKLVDEVSRPANVPAVVGYSTTSLEWKVLVRILGPIEVMTRNGLPIRFEKSKSTELLAWLTTHRSRPSRSAARTALWEVNVQDATFTNVVSDIRRGLGKMVMLNGREEWLARTLTDALPLHMSVTTDGELLDATIQRASSLDADTALVELRAALEYVRGLPFSGADYLWPDTEGITTQLTLTVMTSAAMAAELYLERGDTDGVFWATGRGLKVLPGHEELLALRMRAHALKGDLAAVRAEWSSHQRAIARDVWSGGATSPKLNELCRELLQHPCDVAHNVSE